jgi:hypothetical protein
VGSRFKVSRMSALEAVRCSVGWLAFIIYDVTPKGRLGVSRRGFCTIPFWRLHRFKVRLRQMLI